MTMPGNPPGNVRCGPALRFTLEASRQNEKVEVCGREGTLRGVFNFIIKNMERTRGEIILFALIILGVWISIWAVIFVSAPLEVLSLLIVFAGLIGLGTRSAIH